MSNFTRYVIEIDGKEYRCISGADNFNIKRFMDNLKGLKQMVAFELQSGGYLIIGKEALKRAVITVQP